MNRFFNDGTKAAINAVDTFKSLGVPGFSIGRKFFSERNEEVMQGVTLAKTLIDSLEDVELKSLITNSTFLYQILAKYEEIIR